MGGLEGTGGKRLVYEFPGCNETCLHVVAKRR